MPSVERSACMSREERKWDVPGAGAGAAAQDASTAFWNSAGMTRLDENQLSVGGWFGIINQKLSLNDSTISVNPPGDTNGGEQAGGFVTPPWNGCLCGAEAHR